MAFEQQALNALSNSHGTDVPNIYIVYTHFLPRNVFEFCKNQSIETLKGKGV